MTKPKNSNLVKTQIESKLNLGCDKTQKMKLKQNSKTLFRTNLKYQKWCSNSKTNFFFYKTLRHRLQQNSNTKFLTKPKKYLLARTTQHLDNWWTVLRAAFWNLALFFMGILELLFTLVVWCMSSIFFLLAVCRCSSEPRASRGVASPLPITQLAWQAGRIFLFKSSFIANTYKKLFPQISLMFDSKSINVLIIIHFTQ